MIKLKNNTDTDRSWRGKVIPTGEYYTVESENEVKWVKDSGVITSIQNGDLVVNDGTSDFTSSDAALSYLSGIFESFPVTWAVDRNNTDSDTIIAGEWFKIVPKRIIWDTTGSVVVDDEKFIITKDGIYNCDIQLKLKSLASVGTVELALFKIIENEPDDYWFVLDKKENLSLASDTQLSGYTQFDFYEGEQFYFAIKITGLLASAVIDGDDDYTAWGISRISSIF